MTVGIPRAGALLRGVLAAQLVMLYGPTFAWLIDRWTMSVWHHAHGILISLLVAWLVWRELRNHPELPHGSSAAGYFFVVPSLVLLVLDAGIHTELLSALSLVLLLPGLAFLFLGAERARRILFPLAFLAFTLPIPLSFTEALHLELRQIATAAVAFIVPRLGIPLYTEGTVLHAPSGDLQVADACSGFSTLYASLAVACLVAWLCRSPWRRIAVLAIAAPVAIAANILRVTLLVVLVEWQGVEVLGTSLHTISGLFTFAVALPVILWVGHEPVPERRT